MSFKPFQDASKAEANVILREAPTHLANLQREYQSQFGSRTMKEQQEKYSAMLLTAVKNNNNNNNNNAVVDAATLITSTAAQYDNPECQQAVQWVIQMTEAVTTRLATVEQYITWNIPRMEDGNNFGVSVQLAALKHIQDVHEKLVKNADDLFKYSASRADAMEKCKYMPTSTLTSTSMHTKTSKTTTTLSHSPVTISTSSSSSGGTGGGETESPSKDETERQSCQEDKSVTAESSSSSSEIKERLNAIVAVDCAYWYKAKIQMSVLLTGYIAALDFVEKNSKKIDQPKGSRGSGGHFDIMY